VAPQNPGAQRADQHPRAGATRGHGSRDVPAVTDAGASASPLPLLALRSDIT
jgi:hypothetical protein